jgi:acyl-CoA dehydrogenase
MKIIEKIGVPNLPYSWYDADLSDEEKMIQQTVHDFAEKEVRPACEKMDKMTPEEVIDRDKSPWFELREKYLALGFDYKALDGVEPEKAARINALAVEELGWGDMGFCSGMMVDAFPKVMAHKMGRTDLAEKYADKIGCWVATQPDRGSDVLDFQGHEIATGAKQHRGNLIARVEGDELVIQGQSSAWVSLAPMAEVAILMIQCDYGDGLYREDGGLNGVVAFCPLDIPGVTYGKPLAKIGQRTLPQGEVYFDNVRIPVDHILFGKEQFTAGCFSLLAEGNTVHSAGTTGIARAAFEHALAYVHTRKQGGVELIKHQLVRHRIFKMFERVEVARAISRRAYNYFGQAKDPDIAIAMTAKVHCTQAAFDTASEALQIFGGNGLTEEYPIEKLMRDARATMIEDGESYMLGLTVANRLSDIYDATPWLKS